MDIMPVPVNEQTVAQYAAYLARRLKPSSIKQYINIIRILHLESGLPHPFKDSGTTGILIPISSFTRDRVVILETDIVSITV
ncbi:hypothetical protein V1264_024786 [Littorina saxatilis]|uniref:Uncharacterized protein n=1 Tax=Littorina saxatilis TaxID=31220 RepID=A0AAN9ALL5_9CAEN